MLAARAAVVADAIAAAPPPEPVQLFASVSIRCYRPLPMLRRASCLLAAAALACEAAAHADAPLGAIAAPIVVSAPVAEPTPAAPIWDETELIAVGEREIAEDELLGLPGSAGVTVGVPTGDVIADGATSIGTPDSGRLSAGMPLPFAPALYTRRDATRSFGTSQTLRTLEAAFTALRRERGVTSEVVIGDISAPGGGRFAPHVSHTSGRDIDIRLVLAPGVDRTVVPFAAADVDWDATWALVHSILEAGDVTYVFLESARQPYLRAAAERAGVHAALLDRWFETPGAYDPDAVIRHESGHRAHIHVRLGCIGQGPRCQGL